LLVYVHAAALAASPHRPGGRPGRHRPSGNAVTINCGRRHGAA